MSKLLQQREQMVHPPDAVGNDQVGWSYLHSFNSRPLGTHDIDAHNYKSVKQGGNAAIGGDQHWGEPASAGVAKGGSAGAQV